MSLIKRVGLSPYQWMIGIFMVLTLALLQTTSVSWPFLRSIQPQGHQVLGDPALIWLYVFADLLTALAYLAISSILVYLVYKARSSIPFHGFILAFGLFIVACGITHAMHVLTMWQPLFWLEGYVKAFTAIVSVATALALPPSVPDVLRLIQGALLSDARKRQLEQVNAELKHELDERIRAEEALRESEQRFLSAFEHAAIGMALVAPDGRWLQVNRSICEITGYAEEQLLATTFQAITHPDDLATDLAYLQQLLQGETRSYQMEKRYIHKNGHTIWNQLSVSLVRDRAGQPLYFVSQIQDITQRKHAEIALQESEAGLATAQHMAHLGSWTMNLQTSTVSWSDELFRIHGYKPRSFVPSTALYLNAVHPDDRAQVQAAFDQPNLIDMQYRIYRPDGEIRTVRDQAQVVVDAQNRPMKLMGIVMDITERTALEQQLLHQAFHDPLTHLPNRALFLSRLEQAVSRRTNHQPMLAVLFLDLDRFKVINDSLGHVYGDLLLCAVAERLQANIRPADAVARLGGDEFTILLEDLPHANAAVEVAVRIQAALQAPFSLDGRDVFTSASIGIALSSSHHDQADRLLRDADIAMYQAKAQGKAQCAIFDPMLNAVAEERLELETALRFAIERDELRLHYQPIVQIETGRITGVEALVRWEHPQYGLVAPAKFIPLAEETGQIIAMGRWVLDHACRQVRQWQASYFGAQSLVLHVNLSARQFQHPDLVDDIDAVLRKTGFDPAQLKLEITESVTMQEADVTIVTLHRLKKLGVHLAIDDFGTGYSSLAYLKRFPITTVKIDRSFVREITTNFNDAAIATAIIAMAHRLNLRVVAEGVETMDQLSFLRAHACDEVQGYFFSRPLPAEKLALLVERDQHIGLHDSEQAITSPA